MCCEDKTRTTQARAELCHQGRGVGHLPFCRCPCRLVSSLLSGGCCMRPKSRLPWATTGLALLVGLSLTSRAWAAGHEHDRHDADEHGKALLQRTQLGLHAELVPHRDRDNQLPPGLSKRERLPQGLEKQLRVRGTLPPGLRQKMITLSGRDRASLASSSAGLRSRRDWRTRGSGQSQHVHGARHLPLEQ